MNKFALLGITITMSLALIGCDQEKPKPLPSVEHSGGDGQTGKVPEDMVAPSDDDYKATLLLNDAYSAVEKSDFETVKVKLSEVEGLKKTSAGIAKQVAEIRAKMNSSAEKSTTAPAK